MGITLPKPAAKRRIPVQERSELTVEALRDAALAVVLEEGSAGLRAAAVAERAGVSLRCVYRYFPGRAALVRAVAEPQMQAMLTAVRRESRRVAGRDLEDVGAGLTRVYAGVVLREPRRSAAAFVLSEDPDARGFAAGYAADMVEAIAFALRKAPRRLAVDAGVVAFVVLGVLAGVCRQVVAGEDVEERMEEVREELEHCVCGYLGGCVG